MMEDLNVIEKGKRNDDESKAVICIVEMQAYKQWESCGDIPSLSGLKE